MSDTRFIFEWGIGGVFGLPVAMTFGDIGEDGRTCFSIHIGPLYMMASWRRT